MKKETIKVTTKIDLFVRLILLDKYTDNPLFTLKEPHAISSLKMG